MALYEGDQIAERYRLERRIAVGGMGEVWESSDLRLGRTVAIKVLKPEIGSDPDFLARFRTEAQIAASINHRGIAGVHDYGEGLTPDGTPTAYLVMELVRGEPLSARLANRGKLGTVLTLDLLEQAGRGLYAAHSRGFVHRDVKPANILLADDGTVKLTDFGIAKAAAAAPVTESGMVMGTAHYIAPEQARGDEATPASDVYSLAVVGYECLVGHRPFQANSPVEVAMMHINDPLPPLPTDIPENVRKLIETALSKDPARRYASGGEFSAAIGAVRRGQPPPIPGSVVVQSTSGALPEVGSLLTDRATGPDSGGLAIAGLAAPGMPPLPGNQPGIRTGRGVRKRVRQADTTSNTDPGTTGRAADTSGTTGTAPTGHPGSGASATGSGPRATGDSRATGTGFRATGTGSGAGPTEATGSRATGSTAINRATTGTGPTGTGEYAARERRLVPPPPPRSGRVALFLTFVLLTVAAVAIGVYVVRSAVSSDAQRPGPAATPPTSASAPGAPAAPSASPAASAPAAATTPGAPGAAAGAPQGMAVVDPAGYTGRPVSAALTELRGAGLKPSAVTTTGAPPPSPPTCTVTDLRPTGTIAKGTAVTITCAQH
ncbi:serine/threonine-protein kinase [Pseudonocardia sp.]|uniref:serine/threonine-protein kinase n=1 Tax=Pseudonocardia sp. TaxID=60912 RepID=UPI0039C9AD7B